MCSHWRRRGSDEMVLFSSLFCSSRRFCRLRCLLLLEELSEPARLVRPVAAFPLILATR